MALMKTVGCSALVMAIALASGVSAQTWNEQGDAGSLPGTAQVVTGSGPLEHILGNNGGAQDLFQIQITDPAGFSAWTSGDQGGPGGSADFDTQLWLFDSAGLGVLGNDDNPGGAPFHSGITVPANDGTGSAPNGPGLYFVGISGFNDDPGSAGGDIFTQDTFEEVSGPDGSGGNSPLTGWSGGGAAGSYDIFLTGASFVPEPATIGLLGMGALALLRRRRHA